MILEAHCPEAVPYIPDQEHLLPTCYVHADGMDLRNQPLVDKFQPALLSMGDSLLCLRRPSTSWTLRGLQAVDVERAVPLPQNPGGADGDADTRAAVAARTAVEFSLWRLEGGGEEADEVQVKVLARLQQGQEPAAGAEEQEEVQEQEQEEEVQEEAGGGGAGGGLRRRRGRAGGAGAAV